MRVRFAPSTGCPFGQFVISADTEEDRALLSCFLSAPRDEWRFHHHGTCYSGDVQGMTSFSFGWMSVKAIKESIRSQAWYVRAWRAVKRVCSYEIGITIDVRRGKHRDA